MKKAKPMSKEIISAVIEIIESKGLSQRDICRKMKTQESRFSDIKSGRKGLGLHFLLDFSKAVDVPLSAILYLAETRQ